MVDRSRIVDTLRALDLVIDNEIDMTMLDEESIQIIEDAQRLIKELEQVM